MRPTEVIHLNRHDTVEVACELLRQATAGAQVWVIVPWRAKLARDLFSLKRTKRAAEDAGVELRLVSRHAETRSLARAAGIDVHIAAPRSLKKYAHQLRSGAEGVKARVVPVSEQLGRRWQRKPRIGFGTVLLSLVVIAAVVALLGAMLVALVPGATVEIEPVAVPVSGELAVSAINLNSAVDYGKATIPARVVQVIISGTGETPTTGSIDAPDERASGEVVFVNRTTSPVVIPKGTIVRTGSGTNARFYTVVAAEVPGRVYAYRRVGVIAMDPGPAGNVQPLTINVVEGDLAAQVEVLNDTATTGGTIKRVPMVAPADFDTARNETLAKLQNEALSQLAGELDAGEYIPPETVSAEIMERYFDQDVDQQSDVLTVQMKVVVRGLAIDGTGLESLIGQALTSKAPEGMALIANSLTYKRSNHESMGTGEVRFQVSSSGMFAPVIDEAAIKQALRGKPVDEALAWVSENLQLQVEPLITLTPAWWEYLPWLAARMEVLVSAHAVE
ncbi:MAG: hypothetical protein GX557_04785 [Chloroflexi bacterium]|nr:hypothetical protein [Chloroflexota bacterium]